MTGMKTGAGENPFAGDDDTESEVDVKEEKAEQEPEVDRPVDDSRSHQASTGRQSMQIPYKFRRDGVQDGRDRVPLFIQEDTKSAEREAQRELEDRFDDDVSLTDLREAVMKAGLQHLDEVEANLEEWGYGMTFDD
ncbi:hypothetical protein ACFQAS_14295 [Halopenitus salinus]|uniref:Uncharacterized protein n=1 Tax=Halopenitus salinus TaxID=1198295 RepID=A0ABD5UU88_9EURY